MQHDSDMKEYAAGDDIAIGLTVEHEFDLHGVRAVFEHEGINQAADEAEKDSHRIELAEWRVTPEGHLQRGIHQTTSTVVVGAALGADKALGEYRCTLVETEYRGGRRIPLDLEQIRDICFRVVEEPVNQPKATDWNYL